MADTNFIPYKDYSFRINDDIVTRYTALIKECQTIFDAQDILYEIYDLGRESGQVFLNKLRSGDFEEVDLNGNKIEKQTVQSVQWPNLAKTKTK